MLRVAARGLLRSASLVQSGRFSEQAIASTTYSVSSPCSLRHSVKRQDIMDHSFFSCRSSGCSGAAASAETALARTSVWWDAADDAARGCSTRFPVRSAPLGRRHGTAGLLLHLRGSIWRLEAVGVRSAAFRRRTALTFLPVALRRPPPLLLASFAAAPHSALIPSSLTKSTTQPGSSARCSLVLGDFDPDRRRFRSQTMCSPLVCTAHRSLRLLARVSTTSARTSSGSTR